MTPESENCVFVGEREEAMKACLLLRDNGIAAKLEESTGSSMPDSVTGGGYARVIVPGVAQKVARLMLQDEAPDGPPPATSPKPKSSRGLNFLFDVVVGLVAQWLLCCVAILIPGGLLAIGLVYAPFIWLFRAISGSPVPTDAVDALGQGWEITLGAPLLGCLAYAVLYALWRRDRRRPPGAGSRAR